VCAGLLAACGGLWWRGAVRAARAAGLIDDLARELGMVRLPPVPAEEKTGEHPRLEPAAAG
jgi:hypothetical protein